jgi:hypothetical protein
MMNSKHEVKWSREFGNPSSGGRDYCDDAVISHDGFIVYVIGHTLDFTTLANPINTLDFYIL